ncbi:YicC/YloC family endoribonuclease [Bernardetia sp. MNP-M8]|uniref:YicC/YloC family endoribonuclease n=1 Tax=Bernardetia sp. MNP-M8 TaxID=3127470 RepID=UPI0030CF62CB
MLKSMTGYGSSKLENEEYTINTEIKTVNSKYLDYSLRLPKLFADKEIEVKNLAVIGHRNGKPKTKDQQRQRVLYALFAITSFQNQR